MYANIFEILFKTYYWWAISFLSPRKKYSFIYFFKLVLKTTFKVTHSLS